MTAERFAAISNPYGIEVKPFSQAKFREKYLPEFGYPLCSGLVDGWIKARQQQGDFFSNLIAPQEEFIRFIAQRQAASYYPVLPFTGEVVLSENDRQLLKAKYAVNNLDELARLFEAAGAPDFPSYDFLKFFEAANITVSRFAGAGEDFFRSLFVPPDPDVRCIQVLIIRYQVRKAGKQVRRSHRMGLYYDRSAWAFFDPNAGSIQFNAAENAVNWFREFWHLSSYSTYQSVPGFDFASVYTLH